MHAPLPSPEAMLRAVLTHTREHVYVRDSRGAYVLANAQVAEALGVPLERLIGRTESELGIDLSPLRAHIPTDDQVLAVGVPFSSEPVQMPTALGPRWFQITKTPFTGEDGLPYVLGVATDVTDLIEADQRLIDLNRTLVQVTSDLIHVNEETLDAGIERALAAIGEYAQADRAYLFLRSRPGYVRNTHEWCAVGIEPMIETLQDVSVEHFPVGWSAISRNETIVMRTADLEVGSPEYELLHRQGIQSVVFAPIHVGGQVIGFAGFDSVREDRLWDHETETRLKIVAGIISGALERTQADRALRQQQRDLKHSHRIARLASWKFDLETTTLTGDDVLDCMRGVPGMETLSAALEHLHPDDRQDLLRTLTHRTPQGGAHPPVRVRLLLPDGAVRHLVFHSEVEVDEEGRPTHIAGTVQDVTESWTATEALAASEQRLELALNASGASLWEFDLVTRHTLVQESFLLHMGWPPETHTRLMENIEATIHPDDHDILRGIVQQHENDDGESFEAEFRVQHFNGSWRWILLRGRIVDYDAEGRPRKLSGTLVDIDERKRIELALRSLSALPATSGREFFLALAETLARICEVRYVIIGEHEGPNIRVLAASIDGECLEGITYLLRDTPCEEVLTCDMAVYGQDVVDRFPHDDILREWGAQCYLGTRIQAEDGKALGILSVIHDRPIPEQPTLDILRLFSKNIATEMLRMRAEIRRQEAEQRVRTVLNTLREGVLLTDLDGNLLFGNRQLEEITGFSLTDLHAVKPYELLLPDRDEHVCAALFSEKGDQGHDLLVEMRKQDGSMFWAAIKTTPYLGPDGHQGTLAAISDVTREVQARTEIEALNEALEERVRERTLELETAYGELESFSYSVSHDLRAPLRVINGFSRLLEEDFGDVLGDEGRSYLERIKHSSRRMGRLIDDLLDLSRTSLRELSPKWVNLSEIASITLQNLIDTDRDRQVTVKIQPNVRAQADLTLIGMALKNLLDNAWKFSQYAEHAEIEFGAFQQDRRMVYFVRDNGAGFDIQFRDRLFVPFSRLHDSREFDGTGIGLATVMRVVSRHGGQIWAESEVGKGATFYFTLGSEDSPSTIKSKRPK